MNQPVDPLANLRDIHLPIEPSWWPPAIGWWMVMGVLILIFVMAIRLWRNRRRQSAPSKALAKALEAIEKPTDDESISEALRQISELVRQYAMTRYGREAVAGLSGETWLQFLDKTIGAPCGSAGPLP